MTKLQQLKKEIETYIQATMECIKEDETDSYYTGYLGALTMLLNKMNGDEEFVCK